VTLLYNDETDATGTGNTTDIKTYTLGSGSYSKIITEAEIVVDAIGNTYSEYTFEITYGGSNVESTTLAATGAPTKNTKSGGVIKYAGALATGTTIHLNVTSVSTGTWRVKSLRVYGVN
jgi:hypothetical protein